MIVFVMNLILMYLISIIRSVEGSQETVTLLAQQHVQVNQPFLMNCSSNNVPVGESAEFLVNGGTLTNIRRHNGVCFNTIAGKKCIKGGCQCSEDRQSYAVYHKLTKSNATEILSCKMTFANEKTITSNAVHISALGSPTLILKDTFVCKGPGTVTLVCSLKGKPVEFEFKSWKHTVNGSFIRDVEGIKQGPFFFLVLSPCGYQDAGQYACAVRYKLLNKTVIMQNTTTLSVSDKPFIVKTAARRYGPDPTNVLYSVQFYSSSSVHSVDWFMGESLISFESNEYEQNISQITMFINMHGQRVEVNGFQSEMVSKKASIHGRTFRVCIANQYGGTCADVQHKESRKWKGSSLNILFIMVGVIAAILVSGLIAAKAILTIKKKKQVEEVMDRRERQNEDVLLSETPNQYIEADAYQEGHIYETASRPYNDPVPYQTTRLYESSHSYLEILSDANVIRNSDNYEKVD